MLSAWQASKKHDAYQVFLPFRDSFRRPEAYFGAGFSTRTQFGVCFKHAYEVEYNGTCMVTGVVSFCSSLVERVLIILGLQRCERNLLMCPCLLQGAHTTTTTGRHSCCPFLTCSPFSLHPLTGVRKCLHLRPLPAAAAPPAFCPSTLPPRKTLCTATKA